MAIAQVWLSDDLEKLVEQIKTGRLSLRDRLAAEFTKDLGEAPKVPLGRPRSKFKLTQAQLTEIQNLKLKHGYYDHPKVKAKLDEFKAEWERQLAVETEQRQKAKEARVAYQSSVARRVQEAIGFDLRQVQPSGRVTKQSIIAQALELGLKELMRQTAEEPKKVSSAKKSTSR